MFCLAFPYDVSCTPLWNYLNCRFVCEAPTPLFFSSINSVDSLLKATCSKFHWSPSSTRCLKFWSMFNKKSIRFGSFFFIKAVDGGYTDWSESKCNVKCGGGVKTLTRTCTNSPASRRWKGLHFAWASRKIVPCNEQKLCKFFLITIFCSSLF